MKKIVISCLFFFFTFFIVYNTFIPFRFDYGWRDLGTQIGRIEWRPFTEQVALTDIAGNIILFIPFGFLLYMWLHYAGSRHPILWSVAASATLIPVPDLKATNSFSRISDSGDLLRISSRLIQIWYELLHRILPAFYSDS